MWLSDFQVVLPDRVLPRASVRVEAGRIAEVVEGPAAGAGLAGEGSLLLMPGIVDLHGDMIERELEPRPGAGFPVEMAVLELDKRLAATGVTTAYTAVSFSDSRTFGHVRSEARAREIIETIVRLRGVLLTEMRVHARFEVNNERAAPVLRDLVAAGAVDLVSLTDHTPGQGQYRDLERYVRYISHSKGRDRAEVEATARERVAERRARPQTWELVREVTELARAKGIPLASHDDDLPAKVALMQDLGATISEFPVSLEAAAEAKRRRMWTVMGAPNALRGISLSGNLGALETLRAGLLDALAADYHPAALLRAAFATAGGGLLPLPEAVALVTSGPARAVDLDDRGRIAVGLRADLAVVEPLPVPRLRAAVREGRFIYADERILGDRFGAAAWPAAALPGPERASGARSATRA